MFESFNDYNDFSNSGCNYDIDKPLNEFLNYCITRPEQPDFRGAAPSEYMQYPQSQNIDPAIQNLNKKSNMVVDRFNDFSRPPNEQKYTPNVTLINPAELDKVPANPDYIERVPENNSLKFEDMNLNYDYIESYGIRPIDERVDRMGNKVSHMGNKVSHMGNRIPPNSMLNRDLYIDHMSNKELVWGLTSTDIIIILNLILTIVILFCLYRKFNDVSNLVLQLFQPKTPAEMNKEGMQAVIAAQNQ